MIQLFDPNTGLARAHQGHQWTGWKAARGGEWWGQVKWRWKALIQVDIPSSGPQKRRNSYTMLFYIYILCLKQVQPHSLIFCQSEYIFKNHICSYLVESSCFLDPPIRAMPERKCFFLKMSSLNVCSFPETLGQKHKKIRELKNMSDQLKFIVSELGKDPHNKVCNFQYGEESDHSYKAVRTCHQKSDGL